MVAAFVVVIDEGTDLPFQINTLAIDPQVYYIETNL